MGKLATQAGLRGREQFAPLYEREQALRDAFFQDRDNKKLGAEVVAAHFGIIIHAVRTTTPAQRAARMDAQEAANDAVLGFYQALQRADPQMPAERFVRYAQLRSAGAILDQSRHARRFHNGEVLMSPHNARLLNGKDPFTPHEETGDTAAAIAHVKQVARTVLNKNERYVLMRLLQDATLKAIGAELGVTEGRVSQMQSALIGKLHAVLADKEGTHVPRKVA